MTLAADTSQSSYSAVICVYTGSRGALNQVTNGLQRVSFQATAGVTYYFMVADYIFSQGREPDLPSSVGLDGARPKPR
jgi:hypothetical protein